MLRVLILKSIGFLIASLCLIPLVLYALIKGKLRDVFRVRPRRDRPAILDSFGTHRYLSLPKAGIRIHVVDSGSEGDSRPLMLFVHGFPDFWFSYHHQMKHFSSKFRCVSLDNRGYNESDKPKDIQDYSVRNLASDVKEVVNLLGYQKCILVGHDWGGTIGYNVCTLYPEIVSFYIVFNMPHFKALRESLSNSWSQKLASWYFFLFQSPVLPELLINSFDMKNWDNMFKDIPYETEEERQLEADVYKYVFSQPNALTGPLNYYRCAFQYPVTPNPTTKDDSLVKVPVCSIYGNGDKYLLRDSFLRTHKFVEDFTQKELPGMSHWVHLHAKDDVNRIMEEYIAQRADRI